MKNITKIIMLVLTLFVGFSPIGQPHIFGKIKWIKGGGIGMKMMDWVDVLIHGGSLVLSVFLVISILIQLIKK